MTLTEDIFLPFFFVLSANSVFFLLFSFCFLSFLGSLLIIFGSFSGPIFVILYPAPHKIGPILIPKFISLEPSSGLFSMPKDSAVYYYLFFISQLFFLTMARFSQFREFVLSSIYELLWNPEKSHYYHRISSFSLLLPLSFLFLAFSLQIHRVVYFVFYPPLPIDHICPEA